MMVTIFVKFKSGSVLGCTADVVFGDFGDHQFARRFTANSANSGWWS
jgi:hypothetical protein